MSKTSWFRPADAVLFCPATPRSELQQDLQVKINEECAKINMSVRVLETAGVSIKSAIVNQDLTGCFFDVNTCMPCRDGTSTASHTRRNVLYKGTCLICKAMGITTEYWGESGSSARHRFSEHEDDILNKRTKNKECICKTSGNLSQ